MKQIYLVLVWNMLILGGTLVDINDIDLRLKSLERLLQFNTAGFDNEAVDRTSKQKLFNKWFKNCNISDSLFDGVTINNSDLYSCSRYNPFVDNPNMYGGEARGLGLFNANLVNPTITSPTITTVITVPGLISNSYIRVGNTYDTTAGNIRWNGSNFQGYNGVSWINLDN